MFKPVAESVRWLMHLDSLYVGLVRRRNVCSLVPPYIHPRSDRFKVNCLVLLLTGSTLALTLGVDPGGEGVLVQQGDLVDDVHPGSEQDAGRLAEIQGGGKEAHG